MKEPRINNGEYLAKAVDVYNIVLRHHIEDPITGTTIESVTGIDKRIVASMLREFEKRGHPICSSGSGYFTARSEQERNDHLEKEQNRAKAILFKTSQAMKNYVNAPTLFDQQEAA